jgi:hypothetical protein
VRAIIHLSRLSPERAIPILAGLLAEADSRIRGAATEEIGRIGREMAGSLVSEEFGRWPQRVALLGTISDTLIEVAESAGREERQNATGSLVEMVEALRRAREKTTRERTSAAQHARASVTEALQQIRGGLRSLVERRLGEPALAAPLSRFQRADARLRCLVLTGATLDRYQVWWDRDPYDWLHRLIPDCPRPPVRAGLASSEYEDERVLYVRQMRERQHRYLEDHGDDFFVLRGAVNATGEGITASDVRGPYSENEVLSSVEGLRWEPEGPVPPAVRRGAKRAVPFRLQTLLERLRDGGAALLPLSTEARASEIRARSVHADPG